MSHRLANPLAKAIPVAKPNKNGARNDFLLWSVGGGGVDEQMVAQAAVW